MHTSTLQKYVLSLTINNTLLRAQVSMLRDFSGCVHVFLVCCQVCLHPHLLATAGSRLTGHILVVMQSQKFFCLACSPCDVTILPQTFSTYSLHVCGIDRHVIQSSPISNHGQSPSPILFGHDTYQLVIIGARSRSPHTSELNGGIFLIYIYIVHTCICAVYGHCVRDLKTHVNPRHFYNPVIQNSLVQSFCS